MNKKSYILLLSILCLGIFTFVSINIIKNINFSNQNKTKSLLYLQSRLHLNFLEEYVRSINLDNIKEVKIKNENYNIYAINKDNKISLYVKHKNYKISLFKELIIK